jgi:hypothetical protein
MTRSKIVNNTSQIVQGGGWKDSRVEHIKVNAWITLFVAIVLGGVAVAQSDSAWFYAWVPGGISLLFSLVLFCREKPRAIAFPYRRSGADPRKLYDLSGKH